VSDQPKGIGQEKESPENSVGEKYHTVEELAAMWKVSPRMVERAFENQPGVIQTEKANPAESASRLRIPHRVARLVLERSDPAILDKP